MRRSWEGLAIIVVAALVFLAAWFILTPGQDTHLAALQREVNADRKIELKANHAGLTDARDMQASCTAFPSKSWQRNWCLATSNINIHIELTLRQEILDNG